MWILVYFDKYRLQVYIFLLGLYVFKHTKISVQFYTYY